MDAKTIIERAAAVYASCRTYVDRGSVTASFGDSGQVDRREFRTAFERPARFVYELSGPVDQRLTVWTESSTARVRFGDEPPRTRPLGLALAAASGVTRGSAVLVPGLLLPDLLVGLAPRLVPEPRPLEREVLAGIACYRLDAKHGDQLETVWVGVEDFLFRRVTCTQRLARQDVQQMVAALPDWARQAAGDAAAAVEDFWAETVTTYEPRMDVELRSADLAPPAADG